MSSFPLPRILGAALTAAFITGLPLPSSAEETEWPQFRGPTGQGLSLAKNVPVEWSATKNVAWKVAVPGQGWSSPVISGGRIYLTTAVDGGGDAGLTLHSRCLDARNGLLLWDTEVFQPDPASVAAMHRKNSPASATPIVSHGKLYVHFGHMGTAALDLNGKILWRQTELTYKPVHGGGGSPALAGDTLVFSADGGQDPFVAALDAGTGKVRWKTLRNSPARKTFSFSTPLAIEVEGTTQIISPGSGFVGAYGANDGRELWRVAYGEGYSVVPRPIFAHGMLYVSSGFDRATLYAIKPEGAVGDASKTHVAWTHTKGVPTTPSMLVVGDELYFVSDGGIATCIDAKTGQVHWNERLGGDFSGSPVHAESRIYFQNESGIGTVLRAGKIFEVLAKNELGERSLASPAVIDEALLLRTEGHLWKIAP